MPSSAALSAAISSNALAPSANVNLAEWMVLQPAAVLHGEVWRLVTYPWISGSPLELVFGALLVYLFGGRLEEGAKGRIAKMIVRNGKGGDFRDFTEIEAWAERVAGELEGKGGEREGKSP